MNLNNIFKKSIKQPKTLKLIKMETEMEKLLRLERQKNKEQSPLDDDEPHNLMSPSSVSNFSNTMSYLSPTSAKVGNHSSLQSNLGID